MADKRVSTIHFLSLSFPFSLILFLSHSLSLSRWTTRARSSSSMAAGAPRSSPTSPSSPALSSPITTSWHGTPREEPAQEAQPVCFTLPLCLELYESSRARSASPPPAGCEPPQRRPTFLRTKATWTAPCLPTTHLWLRCCPAPRAGLRPFYEAGPCQRRPGLGPWSSVPQWLKGGEGARVSPPTLRAAATGVQGVRALPQRLAREHRGPLARRGAGSAARPCAPLPARSPSPCVLACRLV